MISRSALLVCASVLLASGCCCQDRCGGGGCGLGGCGRGSLFCQPYEQRMANTNSYECGTCCKPVGCDNGGIKGWLHNQATGCQGCSDVYWGEWISDPPDCCDPCDQCGGFSGNGGCGCKPRILPRLARIFNGYRYCPDDCGSCNILPRLGCNLCGGAGCDSCGGGYSDGGGRVIHQGGAPHGSVLDENWDPAPSPKPTPGKPIHKADTPHSIKVGAGRMPGAATARRASYEPWR
ncbi:MAG: hypothetical protein K8R36_11575 [Planctomycetales bacterium]|nr:hypothetical protein [Planctomycetales bacterium]